MYTSVLGCSRLYDTYSLFERYIAADRMQRQVQTIATLVIGMEKRKIMEFNLFVARYIDCNTVYRGARKVWHLAQKS